MLDKRRKTNVEESGAEGEDGSDDPVARRTKPKGPINSFLHFKEEYTASMLQTGASVR